MRHWSRCDLALRKNICSQKSRLIMNFEAPRCLTTTLIELIKSSTQKERFTPRNPGGWNIMPPDKKSFVITSEKGSGLVRHLALNPLIASEIEAASGKQHHDSSITPANYSLHLLGEQQVGPYHCFVAQAVPKRLDKYLFEGRIWIDIQDFAIVRSTNSGFLGEMRRSCR
jgi:hypothetical protein